MTEGMIANCKKCLSNLMQCEDIYTSDDPIGNFAKALLNYHDHYQDTHSSTWCRFHPKVHVEKIILIIFIKSIFFFLMGCYYMQHETFLEREQNQQATNRTNPTNIINYHLFTDDTVYKASKRDAQIRKCIGGENEYKLFDRLSSN